MRLITIFISATLVISLQVSADVISMESIGAVNRLKNNPNAFDEVDNFCLGKKPKDACLIPGSIIAGGGKGICINDVARGARAIAISCVRQGTITIERNIPCHPDKSHSERKSVDPQVLNTCKEMFPLPADRFCRGKKIGDPCTVKFMYEEKAMKETGVCTETNQITEPRPTYNTTRRVISCESPTKIKRSYTAVPLVKKLSQ